METAEERIREETRQQYETVRTFELMGRLLQKQSELSLTRTLSFEREVEKKTADVLSKDSELGRIAVTVYRLRNQYLFLYQIVERKVTYLVKSMIDALNNDDHLLLALCSRSLVEHAASLSYLVERTNGILGRIEGKKEYKSINEDLEELYTIYERRFYGTRFFETEGLVDDVNVPALVDEYLSPEIKDINEYYAYLSDFVHPNFDSNVLASSSGLGQGITDPSIEEKKGIIDNILRIASIIVEYLEHRIESFASSGMVIDAYLQKALQPATRPETFFVKPPTEFEREDTSKQPATFFTKEGKVWLRLRDGTSFETPLKSIGDVTPEQEVAFSTKEGRIWLNLEDGTSFETPLESVTARQPATFFDKEGKVWLRLGDGTSFETPLKSIGDVTPEQEVALSTKGGRIWLDLEDGRSFETPLESVTSEQTATFFAKEGKVWLTLGDGTSLETPLKSMGDVASEQKVTLFTKEGKIWISTGDGISFETPLKSISRQPAAFFTKGGKVWLRLGDGTSFETPFKSIGDVTPRQLVSFFSRKGKMWLRLGEGISFETPLESISRQIATFFNKEGKIWLRLGDGTSFETPLRSIGDVTPRQVVMFFTKKGKMWLRLGGGVSFETPLEPLARKQTAIFFNKEGKVWLRS